MAVAKAYSASTILGVDISQERLKVAKELVATHVVESKPVPNGEAPIVAATQQAGEIIKSVNLTRPGFDVVIEASGSEQGIRLGVLLARPGGTYVQVGLGPREVRKFF